jgi:hypothetical protein
VTLGELTEEFKMRMNEPDEGPASFNQEQLRINAQLFEAMPRTNEDVSPEKASLGS